MDTRCCALLCLKNLIEFSTETVFQKQIDYLIWCYFLWCSFFYNTVAFREWHRLCKEFSFRSYIVFNKSFNRSWILKFQRRSPRFDLVRNCSSHRLKNSQKTPKNSTANLKWKQMPDNIGLFVCVCVFILVCVKEGRGKRGTIISWMDTMSTSNSVFFLLKILFA